MLLQLSTGPNVMPAPCENDLSFGFCHPKLKAPTYVPQPQGNKTQNHQAAAHLVQLKPKQDSERLWVVDGDSH